MIWKAPNGTPKPTDRTNVKLANVLVRRLQDAFGAGGILHYGEGKWYPGEPLPRWKLAAFWRTDGVPIWQDHALLADMSSIDEAAKNASDKNVTGKNKTETDKTTVTIEQAQSFGEKLCQRLQLHSSYLMPAYEDAFHYILEEGKLPVNIDPLKANLKDPLERRHLADLLQRGLDTPKGYACLCVGTMPTRSGTVPVGLPARPSLSDSWRPRRWGCACRSTSLPWVAQEEKEPTFERSQFEELPVLADYHKIINRRMELQTSSKIKAARAAIRKTKLSPTLRSPSNRATGSFSSLCRRSAIWNTTSNCWLLSS